jgi:site-specific DNA recombinase
MKRVGMYARVSPGRQEQDMTIESQVAAIEARVDAMGCTLEPEHRYIDNGWTSDSLLRPGLEALRDAVALGSLDCVVLHDPDRLSRRFVDQQVVLEEIERKHVEVIFVVGGMARTDEERMALQMRGVFAEFERAKLRERTRRGRLYRARAGALPGWPNPPYGYRYVRAHKPQPASVVIEACEAEVVRQIFTWVGVEKLALRAVQRRLEEQGIRARSGKRWASGTLLGILRNPVYVGLAHHLKRESVEPKQLRAPSRFRRRRKTSYRRRPEQDWIGVPVPALVEQHVFDEVQTQLLKNRQRTAGQAKHPYLLRGLLFCTTCGRKMWGRCLDPGKRYERRYYTCNTSDDLAARGAERCPRRPVRADDVEPVVWEDLARWLLEPEQLAAQLEAQRDKIRTVLDAYAAEQRRSERQMRALTQAIERLVDAYQAGAIGLDELKARRERLDETKRKCQATLTHLEQQHQQAQAQGHVIDELRGLKERLQRGLDRCGWEDRRAIVELLVERVDVADAKLVVHYIVPLSRSGTPSRAPPTAEPGGKGAGVPGGALCQPCQREQAAARGSQPDDARAITKSVCCACSRARLGSARSRARFQSASRAVTQ